MAVPEVVVLHQVYQIHPGADLFRGWVVGEFGHGGAEEFDYGGVAVDGAEGVVDEVVDDAVAFGFGQLDQLVHESHLRFG